VRFRFIVIAGLTCFALACTSESSDVENSPRFAGPWLVTETQPHALYGASAYELHLDGSLTLAWDAGINDMPQGYVRSPDLSISCFFGHSWTSVGDALLVIDGNCTDGVERAIELELASPPASNSSGAIVRIDEVGQQRGWQPPQWGWALSKCPDVQTCRPFGF
jgi:hypothetical protein